MSEIDVVISGIGGRFPSSKHIKEFGDNLLQGKSLLKPASRWTPGILDTPTRVAETPCPDRFDHTFFGMLYQLSLASGPMVRYAVETAYEAVIDAGINPSSLKGTNAHVYAGTSDSDYLFEKAGEEWNSYTVMGKNRSMIANRISYALNLTGTSSSYDVSSGWLGMGLELAREAIQSGECDTVFVSGTSCVSLPEISIQKQHLGLLSPDSACHPFDENAKGVARAESTVTFLVQRADIAKRSYGSIVVASAESQGLLPAWFLSVNEDHLRQFTKRLYNEGGVNPRNIQLLEADGLALKGMVEPELNVLDEILNSNRAPSEQPLLVGSVKTVMGDADAVSGLAALTKLILAMETGIISPTLDCGKLNPNIPGLVNGRCKVVTQPTPWEVTADTLVAVSTLSTGGIVSEVVLKANEKPKPKLENNCPLPYLILISARTEDIALKSLKQVASSPFDPEYIRLTHEVFSQTIDKFECRGFGIHGETEASDFVVQRENRRPVWFVYSGMGSQWPQMGKELMVFPVIKETLQRLHAILEPKGVDLINILTTKDTAIFDNIMHAFVGIAAVQIALTNLLKLLEIEPDGIVGHSVGELGCSYADGCLTEEQTILASYERGMASLRATLIPGLMAAVGLGYAETKALLPPDVCVACRNSKESCTISGPVQSVKVVLKDFEERGIFVRGVNVANIAYHSPYIRPAAPLLLEALQKVIPSPKLRSNKWVCTSQPKEKWDSDEVRYCSPEYHTNNLLNPVLFHEGSEYIPDDALVIEIAPHGLLQAILTRSLNNLAINVPLTRRAVQSPAKFLLKAVGKLFLEGLSPKIWRLYPDVQMPVSRNTPSLVPLIDWDHREEFPLNLSGNEKCRNFRNRELDDSSASVEIAGVRYLVPAYPLVMVLELFAEMEQKGVGNLKAHFDNVSFYDLVKLDEKETTTVSTYILPGNGNFVVMNNKTLVAKGRIRQAEDSDFNQQSSLDVGSDLKLHLKSCDVYSELENRCMSLQDKLKDIQSLQCYSRAWIAGVRSNGDWTSLLNALITIAQLRSNDEDQKPTYVSHIQKLFVDTSHTSTVEADAVLHFATSTVTYPGISLSGAEFKTVPQEGQPKQLSTLKFIPFGQTHMEDEKQFLSHVLQLTLEKRLYRPQIYTIYDKNGECLALNQQLQEVLQSDILIEYEQSDKPKNANLLLCPLKHISSMAAALKSSNTLLLTRYDNMERQELHKILKELGLCIIAESGPKANLVAVGSPIPVLRPENCRVIKMKPNEQIPADFKNSSYDFNIFVWENGTDLPSSVMLEQLTTTECPEKNRLVVLSSNVPPFSISLPFYADQIRLNFPLNIFNEGQWGSYRLVRLPNAGHMKAENIVIRPDSILTDRNGNTLKISSATVRIHRSSNKIKLQNFDEPIGYTVENSDSKRFMGIGTHDKRSEFFKPDPNLVWTVPQGWDLAEASALPLTYGLACYILFEIAELAANDKVLITCPLTPLGQAALRICEFMKSQVIALVDSAEGKSQLEATHPQVKTALRTSTSFMYAVRDHFPGGVDIIVSDLSGERLRTATSCIKEMAARKTHFIQINPDPMHRREHIGLLMFNSGVAAGFYGVTEQTLLNASIATKQRICRWVEEGLQNGLIQPKAFSLGRLRNETNGTNTNQKTGTHADAFKPVCLSNHEAYSVIVDETRDQWIGLAHSLASKGYKHIALILRNPSPDAVRRHTDILQRAFKTELKILNSNINAADLVRNLGSIDAVFVFQRSTFAEAVFNELNSRGMKNTWIVLFEKTPSNFSWKCDQRAKSGIKVRSVLGVRALPTASATMLLDRLQSPDAPAVIVLDTAVYSNNKTEMLSLNQTRLLPTSIAELEQLGYSLRGKRSTVFREVATRGRRIRAKGEVQPLFFIKGIHGTASSEVATLAADLLAPMVEITLLASDSFENTALAVVQGILHMQTIGPYNVAGDSIHAPLVMKVANILESRGLASVVFLIDEGIHGIREGLEVHRKDNSLGGLLLECALSEDVDPKDFEKINWSHLTWDQQIQTALSYVQHVGGCQRENIIAALHNIHLRIQHFMENRETANLKFGLVHTLRKGDGYRINRLAPRCYYHSISPALLRSKACADIISANLATPVLQLNIEKGVAMEFPFENDDYHAKKSVEDDAFYVL